MIKRDSIMLTLEVMKQYRPALVLTGKCQRIHASWEWNSLSKLYKNSPYLTLHENVTDSTEFEIQPFK